MDDPLVSIIVPTSRRPQFLLEALESVRAQQYQNWEVIVVENGGDWGAGYIVAGMADSRIRFESVVQANVCLARNHGVAASSGELIVFMDDDDRLKPHKLDNQVGFLQANPEIGLVAGGHVYIDSYGAVCGTPKLRQAAHELSLVSIVLGGLAPSHAVMLRRKWHLHVGGFDPDFTHFEDVDYWYRLSAAGCRICRIPDIVCEYRLHESNVTRNPVAHVINATRVLDKLFKMPQLPDELHTKRERAYSTAWMLYGARILDAGETEQGLHYLQLALSKDKSLSSNDFMPLAEMILGLESDAWLHDPGVLRSGLFALLRESDVKKLQSTLDKVGTRREFYEASAEGNIKALQRAWRRGMKLDPHWALRRSTIAHFRLLWKLRPRSTMSLLS